MRFKVWGGMDMINDGQVDVSLDNLVLAGHRRFQLLEGSKSRSSRRVPRVCAQSELKRVVLHVAGFGERICQVGKR
jgi:hypothetical protein